MANVTGFRRLIPERVKRVIACFLDRVPVRIERRRPRPQWVGEHPRFSYQARYVDFDIKPGDRVLDVGSGGSPFPHATVLADRFLDSSVHRQEPLVRKGKPLILADIYSLPFGDKCFDFVYCSHLLEHVDDPIRACKEIMRIGKRGFIETPTFGKDALFAWAKDMHKWHVVAIRDTLCFFEYSQRQLDGIKSSVWRDIIFSKWYHPLQEAFYENQDIFNTMLLWENTFTVFVFYLKGSVETLNFEGASRNEFSNPRS